jgi:hypothetical protein
VARRIEDAASIARSWISRPREIVSAVSGGILTFVLVLAFARSAALGALFALVGALGGALLAPALMFAWSFMTWPTRMLMSIDARLSTAEAERPSPILAELSELSTEADMLMLACPRYQSEGWPPGFADQLTDWETRVGDALGQYSEPFQKRFLAEPGWQHDEVAPNYARQRLRQRHEILKLAINRLRRSGSVE